MGARGPKKRTAPLRPTDLSELKKPKYLPKDGREVWDEYAPVAAARGTLQPGDEELFAAFCIYAGVFRSAMKEYTSSRVLKTKNEAWSRAEKAGKQMSEFAAHFGFGQKSRASLGVIPPPTGGPSHVGRAGRGEFNLD